MSTTEPGGSGPETRGVVRYRKKPVTVETMPWTGDNWAAVRRFTGPAGRYFPAATGGGGPTMDVWNSQEQAWICCPIGHSVVRGRLGEFYPISPAAIAETYEPAGSPAPAGDPPLPTTAKVLRAQVAAAVQHWEDEDGMSDPADAVLAVLEPVLGHIRECRRGDQVTVSREDFLALLGFARGVGQKTREQRELIGRLSAAAEVTR